MIKLGVATKYQVEYKFYDYTVEDKIYINAIFSELSIIMQSPQYFDNIISHSDASNLELSKQFLKDCINFTNNSEGYKSNYPSTVIRINKYIERIFKTKQEFAKFCQNLLDNAEPNLETVVLTWI